MYNLLNEIATVEQIVHALGIADMAACSAEFFVEQQRAVRSRFYYLCLQTLRMDLSTDRRTLPDETAHALADVAEEFSDQDGFDYGFVRNWFLARGQFESTQAFKALR